MKFKLIGCLFVFSLLASCASIRMATIATEAPFKSENAYLFGSFANDNLERNRFSMGLNFKNITTKKNYDFIFVCDQNDPLVMIEVTPGEFRLENILYLELDMVWAIKDKKEIKSASFTVEPGKLYYLGDWKSMSMSAYSGVNWKVTGLWDKFEKTTDSIKTKYPAFKDAEAVNAFTVFESDLK